MSRWLSLEMQTPQNTRKSSVSSHDTSGTGAANSLLAAGTQGTPTISYMYIWNTPSTTPVVFLAVLIPLWYSKYSLYYPRGTPSSFTTTKVLLELVLHLK